MRNSRSRAEAGTTAGTRARAPWAGSFGGLEEVRSRAEALGMRPTALAVSGPLAVPRPLRISRPRTGAGGVTRSARTWSRLVSGLPPMTRAGAGETAAIGGPALETWGRSALPMTAGPWPGESFPKGSRPPGRRSTGSRTAETEASREASRPGATLAVPGSRSKRLPSGGPPGGPLTFGVSSPGPCLAAARTLEAARTASSGPARLTRASKRPWPVETRPVETRPSRTSPAAAGLAPAGLVLPWFVSVIRQVSFRSFGHPTGGEVMSGEMNSPSYSARRQR
jgi:hypothetical protein